MRKALSALIIAGLAALAMAHPALGMSTPDEDVASWLANISPFFSNILGNMSGPYVSTVGRERFVPGGVGVTYNVSWYGKYERLSALVTYVGSTPYRLVAVLRVKSSAPWYPYPTLLDVFDEVVSHYERALSNYSPKTAATMGSYNRYWAARYLSLEGHRVYVGLRDPAQVLVRLRDDYGILDLLIIEQTGPLMNGGVAGDFTYNDTAVRSEYCGEVCDLDSVWLASGDSLIPAYVVRSFGDGTGSVTVVHAVTGSVIYRDSWRNEEIVDATPKPLTWREKVGIIAVILTIGPTIGAGVAAVILYRRNPEKGLSRRAGAAIIAAVVAGPVAATIFVNAALWPGYYSSPCMYPPGGLYLDKIEEVNSTVTVARLWFSSGDRGAMVMKFAMSKGPWVSECVRCVMRIPPRSVGTATVEFGWLPDFGIEKYRVSVYAYPEFMNHPYPLGWRRCSS